MPWPTTPRASRGYGPEWDRTRKHILIRDRYLCQPCLRKGKVAAASQVDHIKPKAKGGNDDDQNLQAICKPCHDAKTIADAGGTVKPAIGEDGWPVAR